ncbi:hypothetical protein HNP00_003748 [Arthrobacter sp. AZCC_0090]|nr:hypothetical protein [Arthrobacter sp. AZCC_0090]
MLSKHPGHDLGIKIPTVLAAIREEFGADRVRFEAGGEITSGDSDAVSAAVALARDSDVAVVVVGDIAGLFGDGTSGEGCDAADLRLPGGQHGLVTAVLDTGVPTVLVVLSGRPYALGDYGKARAIVQAFFPGADGAAAVAGILSRRVPATGRLPVQIPWHPYASTTYLQPALGLSNPGITALDNTPLYPFGFGLTRGAIVYEIITAAASLSTGGSLDAAVTIRNDGDNTVEVVQLYPAFRWFARLSNSSGTPGSRSGPVNRGRSPSTWTLPGSRSPAKTGRSESTPARCGSSLARRLPRPQ